MSIKKLIGIIFPICLSTTLASGQPGPPSFRGFNTLGQTQVTPLPLEQAFPFYVSEISSSKMRVTWTLADGHYLYRHAFNFTIKQTEDSDALGVDALIPNGLMKTDQFFGQIEAYYDTVSVDLNFTIPPGPDAFLVIEYQGCADWGFCYPPQKTLFELRP